MKEGMLWYVQDQKKDLEPVIENAVEYFKTKYGQAPQACYVHPDTSPQEFILKDSLKVVPNEKVIKNHIWLEMPAK